MSTKQRQKRWGYKGTETALNGLTGWLYDNHYDIKGTVNQKYQEYIKIIVRYAKESLPEFTPTGKWPQNKANQIAKYIDKHKKFNHFANWAKKNIINPAPINNEL